MSMNFGFLPSEEPADFERLRKQFQNLGFNPQYLFNNLDPHASLIQPEIVREIALAVVAEKGDLPTGTTDVAEAQSYFDIAQVWLDSVTHLPANISQTNAWSRREWLENSISGWCALMEPLADGMSSALTRVISESAAEIGDDNETLEQLHAMGIPNPTELFKSAGGMMRGFVGALISTQLGRSLGELACSIVSSHDCSLPVFAQSGTRLIPQNVAEWGRDLEIPKTEIGIYLALREASAARLFAQTPWLATYLRELIGDYSRGIQIDLTRMSDQAQSAISTGELNLEDPNSLQKAISDGLFTPEQTEVQARALDRLETTIALIDGWVDHLTTIAAQDRLPSLPLIHEMFRRKRATQSPTELLFASLVGLEVSPRKFRECSAFWSKVNELKGPHERDRRWEDFALLPTSENVNDVARFLDRTTVPDDLSGLV